MTKRKGAAARPLPADQAVEKIAEMFPASRITPGVRGLIADAITTVQLIRDAEANYPTRTELRKIFTNTAHLAEQFEAALNNPVLLSWIMHDPECGPRLRAITESVSAIVAFCDATVSTIPRRAGRDRVFPAPEKLDAKGICALNAGLLWRAVKGRRPGMNNEKLHRLCEELWIAAGGSASFGSVASWRLAARAALPKMTDHPQDDWAAKARTRDLRPANN